MVFHALVSVVIFTSPIVTKHFLTATVLSEDTGVDELFCLH